jgi:hypothetical protein
MAGMIIPSFFAGMFSTMNILANRFDDIRFHLNDLYMVSLMICLMVLFSIFQTDGLNSMTNNRTLFLLAIVCIIIYCIRTQFLISDSQYLNGMIPHHSMAITMSKRILQKTKNPKIIKLANNIIANQLKEIDEMNDILHE